MTTTVTVTACPDKDVAVITFNPQTGMDTGPIQQVVANTTKTFYAFAGQGVTVIELDTKSAIEENTTELVVT